MGRPLTFDIAGQTFARLHVIRRDYTKDRALGAYWLCRCSCGRKVSIRGDRIARGKTRSCGCLLDEARLSQGTHGGTRGRTATGRNAPLYNIWRGIIDRCHNKNSEAYPDYGGRGIQVSSRWRRDFLTFVKDVGPRPSEDYSLDRFPDNDGNYELGNTRWATRIQQGRNRRNNFIVTFRGRSMTFAEAVEITGIRYSLAYNRLSSGWPLDEALTPGRRPRSKVPGAPTATVAALGRACQAAGITLAELQEIIRRRETEEAA